MNLKKRLLKMPYGLSSIALGLGTLGNAWTSFAHNDADYNSKLTFNGTWVPFLTLFIALVFILLVLSRALSTPSDYVKHSNTIKTSSHIPVVGLVIIMFSGVLDNLSIGEFSTLTFGATHWLGYFAFALWLIGMASQLIHMIWWIIIMIKRGKLSDIDSSMYVIVVGPSVGTVLAQNGFIYQLFPAFIHFLWYLALVGAIIAFCLMTYRYLFVTPQADFSSFGIYCSALPLLFVTRLVAFPASTITDAHRFWIYSLYAVGSVTTLITYISFFKVWRGNFKTHYASYAFSLITQAFASILLAGFFKNEFTGYVFIWLGFVQLLISSIVFVMLITGFSMIVYYWLFSSRPQKIKNPVINYFISDEIKNNNPIVKTVKAVK